METPGFSSFTGSHVRILASGVKANFLYEFGVSIASVSEAISHEVAVLLKQERQKRGLSLKKLAEESGISRQTISYIEQEIQSPSLDTLLRITLAMKVDLSEVIAAAGKCVSKANKLRGQRNRATYRSAP